MLYFQQVMVSLSKVVSHIHASALHLRVCRHTKEHHFAIHHLFTFLNEHLDSFAFLIQVGQPSFFDFVVWFLLVGCINVSFQVDDVFQSTKPYLAKYLTHITLILSPTVFVGLFQIVVDILFECTDIFLDTRHADFLVHVEHILKELHINVFHFKEITILMDHPMVYQILYPLTLIIHHLKGEFRSVSQRLSPLKHIAEQGFLPVQHSSQFLNGAKM